MKLIFVGSKNMGVEALNLMGGLHRQGLLDICAVIARWDDDEVFWYGSVSQRARELGLPVFMPQKLSDPPFLDKIAALNPDAGFCFFYPKLFPESFFNIPKSGFFNLHFAPLPRYRGALPVPYAILAAEREHGVTIHRIEKGADTGPILSQTFLPIHSDDTGFDLYHRCEVYGINLLQQTINMFLQMNGRCALRPQSDSKSISHKRSDLKSLEVSFDWGIERVIRFVRAFDFPPFSLPFVIENGEKTFLSVAPERHGFNPSDLKTIAAGSQKLFQIDAP